MASNRPESPQSSAALKTEEPPESKQASDASDTPDAVAAKQPAPEKGNQATRMIVMISVFLCMFLVALDRTIISTARQPLFLLPNTQD